MNLIYLADALDHWKGCVIRKLEKSLNDLHVIPMFTDQDVNLSWSVSRLRLYAQLLQVPRSNVLQPNIRFTAKSRAKYFADIANDDGLRDKDFFIDPDTGIEPESGGNWRHIRIVEMSILLPSHRKRVVLIYQHASRQNNGANIRLQKLINPYEAGGIKAFAYSAGAASICFLCRDRRRLNSIHRSISKAFDSRRLSQIFPS